MNCLGSEKIAIDRKEEFYMKYEAKQASVAEQASALEQASKRRRTSKRPRTSKPPEQANKQAPPK